MALSKTNKIFVVRHKTGKKTHMNMVKGILVFLLYKCKTNEITEPFMGFCYNVENLFWYLYYPFNNYISFEKEHRNINGNACTIYSQKKKRQLG